MESVGAAEGFVLLGVLSLAVLDSLGRDGAGLCAAPELPPGPIADTLAPKRNKLQQDLQHAGLTAPEWDYLRVFACAAGADDTGPDGA